MDRLLRRGRCNCLQFKGYTDPRGHFGGLRGFVILTRRRWRDHFGTVTPMSASLQAVNSVGSLNRMFSFEITALQYSLRLC